MLAQFRALDQQLDKIDDQLRMLGNAPDDHEARAQLGLLYTEQGRLTEAAEAYRLAVRLAPDSLRYRNNLGNLYLRLGQFAEAVAEYQAALVLDSEYAKAHYNLGQAYLRLQRFDEALASLARGAPLSAGRRGDALLFRDCYTRALATTPKPPRCCPLR